MIEKELSRLVVDAFFAVYHAHGHGFLEPVYVNSLVIELESLGLSVQREMPLEVHYRGRQVGRYRVDLVVDNRVIIEVKAIKNLAEADQRQLINYLKASTLELGFLMNFGPEPRFLRRVLTRGRKHSGIPSVD
jgi:GxxExxY protein